MRTRPGRTLALAAALTAPIVGAGCGGSGSGPAPCLAGGGSGNLTFVVGGRDAAPVSIDGVPATVTNTDSMSVPAGPHTISAARVTTPQAGITAQVFEPTIDNPTACVQAGETTVVHVRYALIPTSGKLWATGRATDGSTVFGSAPASVAATRMAGPDVAAPAGFGGFTFDRAGNIWMVGEVSTDPAVARYPAAQFVGGGDKLPDVMIDSPLVKGPPGAQTVAFDASGDLWVAAGPGRHVHAGSDRSQWQPDPDHHAQRPERPAGAGLRRDGKPVGRRQG